MEVPVTDQRLIGHRHESIARSSVRLRRDRAPGGDVLAQFMAGNDRRAGHRDGATCLPPLMGTPVQAGDARGWY